jgi:hypothetical protein
VPLDKTIQVLDEMQAAGVIKSYALGGAMAANVYLEIFSTVDFDFFVHIVGTVSSLDPIRPIIDYLTPRGYPLKGVEFDIDGDLIQFVPFTSALTEEATERANVVEVGNIKLRVFSAEYLVAVMLETGRLKDLSRAKIFWDQGAVDVDELKILINRFKLEDKWQRLMQL